MPLRTKYLNAAAVIAVGISVATPVRGQDACTRQQLRFNHFSVEDGLSNNYVRGIFQDASGFLWFGTADGLNRFDGYEFKIYQNVAGDSTTLVGNIVNDIAQTSDGKIWVATATGLSVLDPITQTFRSRTFGTYPVRAVETDDRDHVWIATRGGGLGELSTDLKTLNFYRRDPGDPNSIPSDTVATLHVDSHGDLWVATAQRGLSRLDRDSGSFTHFRRDDANPASISSDRIRSITESHDGTLVVGLWRGGVDLMRLDDPGVFDHANPKRADVQFALLDRSGTLWASLFDSRLGRITAGTTASPTVQYLTHNPSDPAGLSDGDVITMYEDRSGALWFGTWRGGLNRFDPVAANFCHVRHVGNDPNTIASNYVTAVEIDGRGTLWVGMWGGGLARFDEATGGFVNYRHDPSDPTSLQEDRILSLEADAKGRLWVSTWFGGLSRYDPHVDGFVMNMRNADPATTRQTIWNLRRSEAGGRSGDEFLWVASARGVGKWFPDEERFEELPIAPDSRLQARTLAEESDGTLWIGLDDGNVLTRDPVSGNVLAYSTLAPDSTGAKFLASMAVALARPTALLVDSRGRVWAGTQDGLFELTGEDGSKAIRYSIDDGLPNRVVNSIEEDESGMLWLGTHGGLARFDPETGRFWNYGLADGVQGLRFGTASLRDKDGNLYFGGNGGLNIFRPEAVDTEPTALSVVFTELSLPSVRETTMENGGDPDEPNGTDPVRSSRTIDLTGRDQIEVPYRDRLMTVGVAAIGPIPPEGINYEYRIGDNRTGWINLGEENRLALAGLSPGVYDLRVRASSDRNRWTAGEVSLRIRIDPPWWQTGWALFGYVLASILLLATAWRYEFNRARLKERLRLEHATTQRLRELDEAKSRFLANLSHEFRTPLTMIIGPLQQMLAEKPDERQSMVLRNARRLQRLINQILQLSRLEEGHVELNASEADLNQFAASVVRAMTPLAERELVDLSLETESPIVVPFDPELMERVLGNLVSNALKFTPAGGRVRVSARAEGNDAILRVADTGIGIPSDQLNHVFDRFYQVDASSKRRYEGTGIGLALVKELVELHGGSVSVESQKAEGSVFTVRLPDARRVEPAPADKSSKRNSFDDSVVGRAESRQTLSETRGVEAVAANGAAAPVGDTDGDSAPDKPRVLVVDDNADVRSFTRSLLTGRYDVDSARDGLEGLERARTVLPDVIVADVMMPRMDGFELSREIRADSVLSGVPVILLTALAEPVNEASGFGAGADQFVTKPFEPEVLLARIESVLAQRDRLKRLYAIAGTATGSESDIPTNGDETTFESRLINIIEERLDDSALSVERVAEELAMSASTLRRQTKEVLGVTPGALLREKRLQRAAGFLRDGAGNVSEIAFACGFNSIHYFSRAYSAHFGVPPSEHLQKNADS